MFERLAPALARRGNRVLCVDPLGETAAPCEQRRLIDQPTLVVGRPRDPLHPFSDSGMLVEELPQARLVEANSILEWRTRPRRLNEKLARFLEEVWTDPETRPPDANGNCRSTAPVAG